MKKTQILVKTMLGMWCSLGFIRGYESCEYNRNIFKQVLYGIFGLTIYINPLTIPVMIESEHRNFKNKKSENTKNKKSEK